MPSHTKTERAKKKRKSVAKPKKTAKKAKKEKKPKRVASFAEKMGWTTNTEEIELKGVLQPTINNE